MEGEIAKIIRCENKDKYAIIIAQLTDGSEVTVYVGGSVSLWFDAAHNKTKAYVKRKKNLDTTINME